jgi:glycosyltransferase involved in cell wall biosynthesis
MIEIFEKKNQKLPFKLFVFGSGSREKKIQELSQTHKNIHFFGRQNLKTIKRYVENCQYCLMPSECLESFGLSALNALQR